MLPNLIQLATVHTHGIMYQMRKYLFRYFTTQHDLFDLHTAMITDKLNDLGIRLLYILEIVVNVKVLLLCLYVSFTFININKLINKIVEIC